MSNPYLNSGPLVVRDLKSQLWRLEEPAWIDTGITGCAFRLLPLAPAGFRRPPPDERECTHMDNNGRLHVMPGYIYDGSSVPLFGRYLDRKVSQWPGTVHDVLYEAARARKLPESMRKVCDELYRDMLSAFGSFWLTSRICYLGLRLFGGSSASPDRGPEYERRVAA